MFNNRWLRLRSATITEKQPTVQQYPKITSKKSGFGFAQPPLQKNKLHPTIPENHIEKSGFGFAQPPLQNNKLHPTIPKKQIEKPCGFGSAQPPLQKKNQSPTIPENHIEKRWLRLRSAT